MRRVQLTLRGTQRSTGPPQQAHKAQWHRPLPDALGRLVWCLGTAQMTREPGHEVGDRGLPRLGRADEEDLHGNVELQCTGRHFENNRFT